MQSVENECKVQSVKCKMASNIYMEALLADLRIAVSTANNSRQSELSLLVIISSPPFHVLYTLHFTLYTLHLTSANAGGAAGGTSIQTENAEPAAKAASADANLIAVAFIGA